MKKLLGIVVLGLLLCSNAYAASKYFYVSCPSFISKNDSKGKYKDSELFKLGTYIGHTLIKFKHTKKELTKFPTYFMGYGIPPGDPDIWMSFPTEKINLPFMYYAGTYTAVSSKEKITWAMILTPFGIDTDKKEFNLYNHFELPEQGIDFKSTSDYPHMEKEHCEILDKKEFNKIIKEGIK